MSAFKPSINDTVSPYQKLDEDQEKTATLISKETPNQVLDQYVAKSDNYHISDTCSEKEDERWKGTLYINLYTVCASLAFLLGQLLYKRHPDNLSSEEIIFIRSFFAVITCIVLVNKKLYEVMWTGIP